MGNLGRDPEIRSMQSGDRVANLSVATSESWKDRSTGERKEKTEWHRVVIFNQGLVGIIERYLKKGSKVYLEGQLETRKWTDQSGVEKYTTEVVLRNYGGTLTMLDSRGEAGGGFGGGPDQGYANQQGGFGGGSQGQGGSGQQQEQQPVDELEDEIPF